MTATPDSGQSISRERRLERSVRAGDADAVVRLLEGMARKVVAGYYAPGLDRDDLHQEARIGIAKAVHDFDGRTPFKAFAWMCAQRQVMTAVKTATRDKRRVLNEAISLHATPPGADDDAMNWGDVLAGTDDVVELLLSIEHLQEVIARLDLLTPLERAVLGRNLGGQPYEEIVAALPELARSTKAVDNALQRAMKKLRSDAQVERPPRHGVLLVDRELHVDERAAVRVARQVVPGCQIVDLQKKKLRGGRVVAPQGRPAADGSLGRPVWAVEIAA
jgi:RNA polymerase sporulation-specific sigma factor